MADGNGRSTRAEGRLAAVLAAEEAGKRRLHAEEPIPEERSRAAAGWPQPIDLERLAGTEPEPPAFIVNDWLPCGYATLLAGHGGVGKSGIALHLAACIALGRPFFGLQTEQRRVLYLSCEDRENVIHWRLARIAAHMGIDLASLRGQLDILDLVGCDTILWERDPRSGHALSLPFGELGARITGTERQLVIVDGITDTFGGNLNAPGEVKRFVNALVSLIEPKHGAVLLVGHVSKPTATTGASTEGYSGTAAWHNAVRARWYLYPEKTDEGKSGDLLLELQKSNLGRNDQEMRFSWDAGAHLFTGQTAAAETHLDKRIREESERQGVIDAFLACASASVIVPAAVQGSRTAYHVLAAQRTFPDSLRAGKPALRRFQRIIEQLRAEGRLAESEYRRANRTSGVQLTLS